MKNAECRCLTWMVTATSTRRSLRSSQTWWGTSRRPALDIEITKRPDRLWKDWTRVICIGIYQPISEDSWIFWKIRFVLLIVNIGQLLEQLKAQTTLSNIQDKKNQDCQWMILQNVVNYVVNVSFQTLWTPYLRNIYFKTVSIIFLTTF